jgi:hypothetical protein
MFLWYLGARLRNLPFHSFLPSFDVFVFWHDYSRGGMVMDQIRERLNDALRAIRAELDNEYGGFTNAPNEHVLFEVWSKIDDALELIPAPEDEEAA